MCLLSLLFMVYSIHAIAGSKHHKTKTKGVVYSMTALYVNPPNNDETFIGIIFRESQRKYKLPKDANPQYLDLLKESEKKHIPVLVERVKEESDVIVSVKRDTTKKKE